MTNNTADRVDEILATFLFDWHQIDDHNADKSDYHKAKTAILTLIEAERREARIDELERIIGRQLKDKLIQDRLAHLTPEEGKEG